MINNDLEVKFSKEVVDAICCPVSLEPYRNAQIVNCTGPHSFSLDTITSMFGRVESGKCENPGPCPLCRGRVTHCSPNLALQSLVDGLLGVEKGQAHIDRMYALLRKLKLEFDAGGRYPLASSEFVLKESHFSENYTEIGFTNKYSDRKDSSIKTLYFSISSNKYVVTVYFHKDDKESKHKLHEYMQKNNIKSFMILEHDFYQGNKIYYSSDKLEFIACLRLLIMSNEFDDKARTKLTEFLEHADSR